MDTVVAASPPSDVPATLPERPEGCTIRLMRDQVPPERVGSALQALATDLAAARREVMLLRRENRRLMAELAALKRAGEDKTLAPRHSRE